jgi:hypothetical protein
MSDPFSRPARPWDLYNKNLGRVQEAVAEGRMAICRECPKFISLTTQCLECGCFMNLKTKLPNAECPIHKWGQVMVGYN